MATSPRPRLIQGNEACVEGAIAAGMRFFAGYPITPSTEIAEACARLLPSIGGTFIQMEDEIASIAAVLGASVAGVKAMTATSGPGFSLMQENIGYAGMAEIPCVIVNVQRLGPSTGVATAPAQGDVMQTIWGTHGDHPVIVLSPASVKEMYELTARAFSLSEEYRVPVIVLADEVIAHLREAVVLDRETLPFTIVERKKPSVPPSEYLPYRADADEVPPMASFGDGYRYQITGLIHDETGFPSTNPEVVQTLIRRLHHKIGANRHRIAAFEGIHLEDADLVIVAYGSMARSAIAATKLAKDYGLNLGVFRPITLHPFPEEEFAAIAATGKAVLVPEMNMGQLVLELQRIAAGRCPVVGWSYVRGELPTPDLILAEALRLLETEEDYEDLLQAAALHKEDIVRPDWWLEHEWGGMIADDVAG
ncbi:MAG: 2-oxoacid:acceptor oxidoreductase subunit alpha [Dehalococcoidia bacterium]|nr:2-oxoacid:acceptor oxidoreductase subunit alpha [Dehalococcoidia bacterium]